VPDGLSPYFLLPQTAHFVTYDGSLTYPGCHETVTWIVMNKPIFITEMHVSVRVMPHVRVCAVQNVDECATGRRRRRRQADRTAVHGRQPSAHTTAQRSTRPDKHQLQDKGSNSAVACMHARGCRVRTASTRTCTTAPIRTDNGPTPARARLTL
jgi:hypothetical protein